MRILSANIQAPANRSTTSNNYPAADKTRALSEARDSYRKNSSNQIIDAEYVEFYSPSINLFDQERRTLDNSLEPGKEEFDVSEAVDPTSKAPALKKYELKVHDAPPPGSYVDIFA